MTCQNCGHENAPEAHFCASCGNPFASNVAQPGLRQFERHSDDLQQRNLGELINETYYTYKRNFKTFPVIASVPQIPLLVASVSPDPGSILFSLLVGLLLIPLAAGATIYAVARQYVSQRVGVAESHSRVLSKVIYLIVAGLLIGIPILLIIVIELYLFVITIYSYLFLITITGPILLFFITIVHPILLYLVVVWFFTPQAIILEDKGSLAAFRRSRALVKGSWWRVSGIGVVFVLIMLGLFSIATLSTVVFASLPAVVFTSLPTILGGIVTVIISAVVFPIVYIGGTLTYIDLRVREEGYNLDMMASEMQLS